MCVCVCVCKNRHVQCRMAGSYTATNVLDLTSHQKKRSARVKVDEQKRACETYQVELVIVNKQTLI